MNIGDGYIVFNEKKFDEILEQYKDSFKEENNDGN